VALQRRPPGQALNHPELRWLKTVVVSVREKAHKMRQVGTRKTCQKRSTGVTRSGVAVEASRVSGVASKPRGMRNLLGLSLADVRVPARWCPAYRRREPGLLLLLGT
jgi:hypothetical protein